MRRIITLLAVLNIGVSLFAQQEQTISLQHDLAHKTKNYFEGFQNNIGSNDFTYPSHRNDVSKSILTRASDGNMAIEWKTQTIPSDYKKPMLGFLWIAAIDLTDENVKFNVFINDKQRFTITSGNKDNWTVRNPEGAQLDFLGLETDRHGDAHGYMYMNMPSKWIEAGQAVQIKMVGEAANSNTWIIVYQAKDALDYLQQSVLYNKQSELSILRNNETLNLHLKMPQMYVGETISYKMGEQTGSLHLKKTQENSEAKFTLSLKENQFGNLILSDKYGEIISVPTLDKKGEYSKILDNSLLEVELFEKTKGAYLVRSQRIYKPKMIENIKALANSKLATGQIFLMNSSHQDIAWMDAPEKCIIERDTMLLEPLYEKAIKDPSYRFDIEDALMVKEFINRHPDKKEGIKQMLSDGRLSCGSSYIQPYEEMYSGEALVRQFYFGAKWLKKEFGYTANTYWNVDVPGRTLQMPQILKKSGTRYMMISRHDKGLFNWEGPDGSSVMVYSPGHYANAYTSLHKSRYNATEFLAGNFLEWDTYYSENKSTNIIPLLSDYDMSPAEDYSPLIKKWEDISELQNEDGKTEQVSLPKFKISTAPNFFETIEKNKLKLNSIMGERPAVWLYIHGPSHQKALKASREGDILLTAAEKFATINALIDQSFIKYPQLELNRAWEAKIYPDHGWGGKQGQITDAYFAEKFRQARDQAKTILSNSLEDVASKIKTNPRKGIPLVVFNSLSWERNDPVSFNINFNKGETKSIIINNAKGKLIKHQLKSPQYYEDGSIQSAQVHFIAHKIPSIGYKTFYLVSSQEQLKDNEKEEQKDIFENDFYKILFTEKGISSIYDKELSKELIDSEKFAAGEVFTMASKGHGAGEFSDIQQATMEGFDKTGHYTIEWEIVEQGSVFTSYKMRQPIRNAVVEQIVTIYHPIKKIDFNVALLNWEGVLYREYRMALPLKMDNSKVAYEVPFGMVRVGEDEIKGAAGERHKTICKDIHPRGIENWIAAQDNEHGVTLSSSVAVADYIDPTTEPVKNTILQPILLASRRSCHPEGNEYLQTGDHSFHFSLSSHKKGWNNSLRFGKQSNEKLQIVVNPNTYKTAKLPEAMSFFSLDAKNAIISTIKKSEDGNGVILRVYEVDGKEVQTKLSTFSQFESIVPTNLIEDESKNALPIQKQELGISKYGIETFKLQ